VNSLSIIPTTHNFWLDRPLEPAKRKLVVKLYREGQHSIDEICRMMGISKPTLYSYVAEAQTTS
jgi:transposase-like protein